MVLYLKGIETSDRRLAVLTSDTLDADTLRRLMNAEFILGGRTMRFDSIEPCADHYEVYGCATTEKWNEIEYRVA